MTHEYKIETLGDERSRLVIFETDDGASAVEDIIEGDNRFIMSHLLKHLMPDSGLIIRKA